MYVKVKAYVRVVYYQNNKFEKANEELTNEKVSTEEYIKNIENVSKQAIIKIANSLQINTIYFLKNKEVA